MAPRSPVTEPGDLFAAFRRNTDELSCRAVQPVPVRAGWTRGTDNAKAKTRHLRLLWVRALIGCRQPAQLPGYRDRRMRQPKSS
jgi:hypothetical protein